MPDHRPPESQHTGDKPTRALSTYILIAFFIALVTAGIYISYDRGSTAHQPRAPKSTQR